MYTVNPGRYLIGTYNNKEFNTGNATNFILNPLHCTLLSEVNMKLISMSLRNRSKCLDLIYHVIQRTSNAPVDQIPRGGARRHARDC